MKPKIGSLEWLEDYLFDKLQQIKRSPRYVSFCRKVPFDDEGIEYSIKFSRVFRGIPNIFSALSYFKFDNPSPQVHTQN